MKTLAPKHSIFTLPSTETNRKTLTLKYVCYHQLKQVIKTLTLKHSIFTLPSTETSCKH